MAELQPAPSLKIGLTAAARSLRWQSVLRTLSEIRLLGKLDAITCSLAVSCCARAEEWTKALQTLQSSTHIAKLRPDTVLFNSVLPCFRGNWKCAFEMQRAMQTARLQHDAATCNGNLAGCRKQQAWRQAVSLLACSLMVGIQLDIVPWNIVISALELDVWPRAILLLLHTHTTSVQPDLLTYNSAVTACEKTWEYALTVHSTSCSSGSLPDSIGFGAIINACEKGMQWQAAIVCLRMMHEDRLSNGVAYSAAVHACERCAQWELALLLLDDLMQSEIKDRVRNFVNASVALIPIAPAQVQDPYALFFAPPFPSYSSWRSVFFVDVNV